MLNAFRHQSGSHPAARRGLRSASRSAQRLPASKRFSRSGLLAPGSAALVLNAFRHQSGSHTPCWTQRGGYNACSTPSGIKAVLTLHTECGSAHVSDVLNAFRHQSGSHAAAGVIASAPVHQCSTPSGIKAVLTPRTRRPSWEGTGAQRLPASKRFSLRADDGCALVASVLNAFRHQSGSHFASSPETATLTGAQRLPASKRFSLEFSSRSSATSTGAQRLPASKRFSPFPTRPAPGTPPGAQRLPASKRFSQEQFGFCRTPSSCAQRLPASKRFSLRAHPDRDAERVPVLNAFRHQSGSHGSSVKVSGTRSCREFFMDPGFRVVKKRPFYPVPPRCLNRETTESERGPVAAPTSPP